MGFMPDDLFGVFGRRIGRFLAVDGGGFVCLYCTATEVVVLCDLGGMRWSLVPPCPLGGGKKWFGFAVEPDVELLR
ncbi:hypothetical protein QJS04_geneDACA009166 [Acorus gramineus]|uniref:Uncharacterized protein n=1 Tax=Acorus gramineus TaxID=55184 RepID=A0AAV9AQJ4_ACOGR|nr:hypothetical protein QJS04_geneDACA009166 [Acorus gramineus]